MTWWYWMLAAMVAAAAAGVVARAIGFSVTLPTAQAHTAVRRPYRARHTGRWFETYDPATEDTAAFKAVDVAVAS